MGDDLLKLNQPEGVIASFLKAVHRHQVGLNLPGQPGTCAADGPKAVTGGDMRQLVSESGGEQVLAVEASVEPGRHVNVPLRERQSIDLFGSEQAEAAALRAGRHLCQQVPPNAIEAVLNEGAADQTAEALLKFDTRAGLYGSQPGPGWRERLDWPSRVDLAATERQRMDSNEQMQGRHEGR
ncbi:MAG: hypothetical protein AMXMBFR13_08890 [Phycisphaerae bacterium]